MLLEKLTALRGATGDEKEIRAFIRSEIEKDVDRCSVDALGNLIAFKRGTGNTGKKVLLCAHMDEVGLIVSNIRKDGFLLYQPLGSIDPAVLVSKRVLIGPKRLPGVLGAKAIHLQSIDERTTPMQHKDLAIDIGADTKEQAQRVVTLGDSVVFDTPFTYLTEDVVCAKALDDRAGCYALMQILKNRYDWDLYAVFSSQEEIGSRGAKVAAHKIAPDLAFALEGTSANDTAKATSDNDVCLVGKGVAVSFMDNASIATREVFKKLLALGKEKGIPFQIKRAVAGGNDGGVLHLSGAKACVLSIPCRYIHSPVSICSLKDIEAMVGLVDAYLRAL